MRPRGATCVTLLLVGVIAAPASAKKPYRVVAQTKQRIPTLFFKNAPVTGEGPNGAPHIDHMAIQTRGKHRVRRIFSTGLQHGFVVQDISLDKHGGWTPCCQRVYKIVDVYGRDNTNRLVSMNVDGTHVHRFATYGSDSDFSLSDVSQRTGRVALLKRGGSAIAIANRDGSAQRTIYIAPPGTMLGPAKISRGGKQVAFTSSNAETGDDEKLQVINSDGSSPRTIFTAFPRSQGLLSYSFSDQGARLLFTANFDDYDEDDNPTGQTGSWELYIANTLGFGATQLTRTRDRGEIDPVFDPRATEVAYQMLAPGQSSINGDIFVTNVATRATRRLTNVTNRLRFHIPTMWIDVKWQRRLPRRR